MSENSTIPATEQELELVNSEQVVEDPQADVQVKTETTDADGQTDAEEKTHKRKTSLQDVLNFIQTQIFTPTICSIFMISLGSLITLFCLIQMISWGFSIKDTYLNYWDAIRTLDYINILVMLFMMLFVTVLFVNLIRSIVSLIKKGHEPTFEAVSTLFAFCLFSMFITELFADKDLLISNFKFEPLLTIIIVLVLGYAVVRLFAKDFVSRIYPFVFACGAIALCIIMYTQGIGNFASYSAKGLQDFELAELNIYRYFQSVVGFASNGDLAPTFETAFLELGMEINISGIDFDETLLMIIVQFVPVFVAKVLPFAAISLLGYLMFVLTCEKHIQYYKLQSCKKISIMMLVLSGISLIATLVLYFVCEMTYTTLEVHLNYVNIILTILFCAVMIVITAMPWRIYNIIYNHRFAAYKKVKGATDDGTFAM